jgi:hypothetical protein
VPLPYASCASVDLGGLTTPAVFDRPVGALVPGPLTGLVGQPTASATARRVWLWLITGLCPSLRGIRPPTA